MKCEKCGFEMDEQYLKDNHMGITIPKYCKKCVDDSLEIVKEIEQRAKDKYVEQVEWSMIIDSLSEDDKEELNKAYKIGFGEEYPSLRS